jgi:hypothetical protein
MEASEALIIWNSEWHTFTLQFQDTIEKALRLLDLIESGILEDSQCGDTGKYGYWIEPEYREKIKEILDD